MFTEAAGSDFAGLQRSGTISSKSKNKIMDLLEEGQKPVSLKAARGHRGSLPSKELLAALRGACTERQEFKNASV